MYQKVKGMRDFYPVELNERKQVFAKIRSVVDKAGFLEVESPAVETLSLLSAKQGDEIKKQIFVIEKKGKEDLALRFDLTVPLARMYSLVQISSKKPVKWYSLSRMWRYEQPQKGRLREFYQLSVELYGSKYIESDFEIISLGINILKELGLSKEDFVIYVNNRDFLEGYLVGIGVKNINEVFHVIDSYTKKSEQEFKKDLSQFLSSEQVEEVLKIMTFSLSDFDEIDMNEKMHSGYKSLKELFDLLEYSGLSDFVEFKSYISRGLDYYTGTVFECFDRDGKFRAVFGGGRYDNLIKQFGGQKESSVGFAIGDATLELLLKDKGLWPESKLVPDYFIAPIGEEMLKEAFKLAFVLRKKFIVDIDLTRRKLAKQLFYANSISARKAIILGENEFKQGKVIIRNMVTGVEEKVLLDDLLMSVNF